MEQTTNEAIVPGKRGRKPLIIAGVIVALVLAGYLALCAYARALDVFYPNSSLNGVDVSGMTVSQAAEQMRRELPQKVLECYLPLAHETGDGISAPEGALLYEETPSAVITYGELGLTGDLDYTVQTEFVYRTSQRQQGFFSTGWDYLMHLLHRRGAVTSILEPDEAIFQSRVSALAEQFSSAPQDAFYKVGETVIQVTKAKNGLHVPKASLENAIREIVSQSGSASLLVEAQVLPAQTLAAQEIHDTVSGEVKNAGYDTETGSITPEQAGADFDVDAAQALLDAAAPGETVSVPADIQLPKVTAAELEKVLFRDVLGESRTHVSGTAARISNVKLASAAFNGTVLNSGDVFSYNAATGERTISKGYQAAPAYVKGETVDEIGGGVCQPSSTLYLACLRANLEITERYAHRYVPTYITKGMDATVSWGGPDYKFTNNTDYPIKIVATYAKSYLTVQILGTKTDDITVKMTFEQLSSTPFETVYEDDPTLAPGTEQVKTTPYTGYKVKTYRNLYDGSGNLISSTYEATSDYKVRNKVILKGPAKADTPEVSVTGPAEIPPEIPVAPPVETTEPNVPETPVQIPEEPAVEPPVPIEPEPLTEQ